MGLAGELLIVECGPAADVVGWRMEELVMITTHLTVEQAAVETLGGDEEPRGKGMSWYEWGEGKETYQVDIPSRHTSPHQCLIR